MQQIGGYDLIGWMPWYGGFLLKRYRLSDRNGRVLENFMNWLDIVSIDPDERHEPLYVQIVSAIRNSISSGILPSDSRLPTNRELAALLKVDRSTVSRAYAELSQQGLIESHVGRGTFVKGRTAAQLARNSQTALQEPSTSKKNARSIDWSDKFSKGSNSTADMITRQPSGPLTGERMISFGGGIPTQEFYPDEQFKQILNRIIKSGHAGDMFGYSPAEGHEALRHEVKLYLKRQGIDCNDDELLIVSGSQQGIDLVSNTLVDAGDIVLLEEPTYFWALCNFRARQARCIGIPVDATDGLQLDVLERLLTIQRPKLMYLMPSFQNPTGATLTAEKRLRLLEIASQNQVPLVEDNFVGELWYDGEPPVALRAHPGTAGSIIHQGTFSKALCPGLRLGWLVAPAEVMSRLRTAKRASDLSTNSMAQVVLARYLREGLYEAHLENVRNAYRSRRNAMIEAMGQYLMPEKIGVYRGQKVQWSRPSGGLFVWMQLPAGLSARELLGYAEREGVSFSPGELFFVNSDRPECLRLCFIQAGVDEITEGIRRLGKALASYIGAFTESAETRRNTWTKDNILI